MKTTAKLILALTLAVFLTAPAAANEPQENLFNLAAQGNTASLKQALSDYNILSKAPSSGETLFHVAKNKETAEVLYEALISKEMFAIQSKPQVAAKDMLPSPVFVRQEAKINAKALLKTLKDAQGNDIISAALFKNNKETALFYSGLIGKKGLNSTVKEKIANIKEEKKKENGNQDGPLAEYVKKLAAIPPHILFQ